ncbi:hypothetical protein Tsubulata_041767 [Turnera subulata]|uniref:KIB1-4 beta-propeller domain-containing protein n=1 Tax=Turnera subulata TaxID=218843 RepID=A0A9Q0GA35_9ROSI|nr:hypothetical protein Tsubulata_041767 [Turnera subulata]
MGKKQKENEKKKKKSQNKNSTTKEEQTEYWSEYWSNNVYTWPDVPRQLLHQIDAEMSKRQRETISFGTINGHKGVTKSWTTEPNCDSPNSLLAWLRLVHDPNPQHRRRFVVGLSRYYSPNQKRFALLLWEPGSNCSWMNPAPSASIAGVFVSGFQGRTVMVLTGNPHPAFAIYGDRRPPRLDPTQHRRWGPGWTTLDCNIEEPHGSGACGSSGRRRLMEFTNGIWFKDKFYALSLQGSLAVLEDVGIDMGLQITALGKRRVVPSVASRQFRECLVESNGEVLLIFLISRNPSFQVGDVEVYKLDTEELTWKRMDSLGDRAVFLGFYCCMSVKASEVGCKKNSVYFTSSQGWWVYEMGSNSIFHDKDPVWATPRSGTLVEDC